MPLTLTLNKQEVVLRFINTSTELFFTLSDPVSIHNLISSAERILCDLCYKVKAHIFEDNLIPPEIKKEYYKAKRVAYNFMKHAEKDAKGTINFKPQANEILMFLSIIRYKKL